MATATSTNILTPEFIKERIVLADDQNWAFRSLILLVRYMESDLTGYRNSLGKIENRNSPRYWMDWMSRSLINRTMRRPPMRSLPARPNRRRTRPGGLPVRCMSVAPDAEARISAAPAPSFN